MSQEVFGGAQELCQCATRLWRSPIELEGRAPEFCERLARLFAGASELFESAQELLRSSKEA